MEQQFGLCRRDERKSVCVFFVMLLVRLVCVFVLLVLFLLPLCMQSGDDDKAVQQSASG